MKICVCVGSSCHLKGSYDIINLMKAALEKYGLTDTVDLSAAFCLGKCTHGVSIKVDDEIVTGLNRDNFDDIFAGSVLATNPDRPVGRRGRAAGGRRDGFRGARCR